VRQENEFSEKVSSLSPSHEKPLLDWNTTPAHTDIPHSHSNAKTEPLTNEHENLLKKSDETENPSEKAFATREADPYNPTPTNQKCAHPSLPLYRFLRSFWVLSPKKGSENPNGT
jgi:hypothetical protein